MVNSQRQLEMMSRDLSTLSVEPREAKNSQKNLKRSQRRSRATQLRRLEHTNSIKNVPTPKDVKGKGKLVEISASKLPWKSIKLTNDISLNATEEGLGFDFEELDGVEVIYEDDPKGNRVIKFKVRSFGVNISYANCKPLFRSAD